MADPEVYKDLDKLKEANNNYDGLKKELETKNNVWETIVDEIGKLE